MLIKPFKGYFANNRNNEKGYLMILALGVFLLIMVIESAILSNSFYARKLSANNYDYIQAQLAADSGLEWARVYVHKLLDEQISSGNTSEVPALENTSIIINSDRVPISFDLIFQAWEHHPDESHYIVPVVITGKCGAKIKYKVIAKLRFNYDIIEKHEEFEVIREARYHKGIVIYHHELI